MIVRAAAAAAAIALRNLVDNAFVHGATAEQPRITVQAILRDGMLELVVTDNGRGIPPEHHDRVFELFSRLHPEASEGTGVGLVGARRAVERAGGKLFLESEAGKGARFTVRLPTERVAGSAQAGVAGPRNLKVLLVEDDALDAKQTRLSLDEAVVTWVATLADAESASLRMRFDLILLDLSLPDGPGLSAVTTLRSGRNARTPIAVLTGLADGISERLLRSLEVAAVIEKGRSQGPGIRALVGQLLGAPAPVGEDARSAARTRAAPPPAPDTGESGPASA
ncbi:MAG: ATP-binding protein [Myxococcota bacterium]